MSANKRVHWESCRRRKRKKNETRKLSNTRTQIKEKRNPLNKSISVKSFSPGTHLKYTWLVYANSHAFQVKHTLFFPLYSFFFLLFFGVAHTVQKSPKKLMYSTSEKPTLYSETHTSVASVIVKKQCFHCVLTNLVYATI